MWWMTSDNSNNNIAGPWPVLFVMVTSGMGDHGTVIGGRRVRFGGEYREEVG